MKAVIFSPYAQPKPKPAAEIVAIYAGTAGKAPNAVTRYALWVPGIGPVPIGTLIPADIPSSPLPSPEPVPVPIPVPSASDYWKTISASQIAVTNHGYLIDSPSLVTLTLPNLAAVNDRLSISGIGTGGWRLDQNSAQQILVNDSVTTPGIAGRLNSVEPSDGVELICIAPNLWKVVDIYGSVEVL